MELQEEGSVRFHEWVDQISIAGHQAAFRAFGPTQHWTMQEMDMGIELLTRWVEARMYLHTATWFP